LGALYRRWAAYHTYLRVLAYCSSLPAGCHHAPTATRTRAAPPHFPTPPSPCLVPQLRLVQLPATCAQLDYHTILNIICLVAHYPTCTLYYPHRTRHATTAARPPLHAIRTRTRYLAALFCRFGPTALAPVNRYGIPLHTLARQAYWPTLPAPRNTFRDCPTLRHCCRKYISRTPPWCAPFTTLPQGTADIRL